MNARITVASAWIAIGLVVPIATAGDDPPRVRVAEATIHGDMDCFRVETPSATYLLGKRGAGLASLIDREGHDWISYRPGDKARGEYRGLPKCGQPTKFFHCGYGYGQYKTENVFTSRIVHQTPDHVRVESETRDGKTTGAWDFYPDRATFGSTSRPTGSSTRGRPAAGSTRRGISSSGPTARGRTSTRPGRRPYRGSASARRSHRRDWSSLIINRPSQARRIRTSPGPSPARPTAPIRT
jgi:hypothetical protein